jgi:hypothetical protein
MCAAHSQQLDTRPRVCCFFDMGSVFPNTLICAPRLTFHLISAQCCPRTLIGARHLSGNFISALRITARFISAVHLPNNLISALRFPSSCYYALRFPSTSIYAVPFGAACTRCSQVLDHGDMLSGQRDIVPVLWTEPGMSTSFPSLRPTPSNHIHDCVALSQPHE